jgi:hypothetical protein
MIENMLKIARSIFAAAIVFALPISFALAQTNAQLNNPLSSDFSTIPKFIAGSLKVLVMVALPIITFFIVYSGVKFITAQGNQSKLSEAKSNFQWVIIGAILILSAWIIATLIGGTVSQLTGSGGGTPVPPEAF